ncbi:MAG: preprotein translocase subunit SecY [Patescibacteria group bacterium]|nr:preprotein translocase subunit SecY [Patescibacteria group bacterium]MDD4304627.1 preprotein translocase subunit SecY [Patescibacteria group bacterium]MDD4695554.1 preprotein translocase subunit SecY [Patescibacteria group bacterium]
MLEKIKQIYKIKDLRNAIGFVFVMLIITRIVAHIPIPGVNIAELKNFFESNQILGLLNIFSGNGLKNFSVVMLGIGPYITASIIVQLLTMIIPSLEAISKEGESGQKKINQYTKYLTVPLTMMQSYGFIKLFQNQSQYSIIGHLSVAQYIVALVTIAAGTMFLVWIGDLITEKKIGNGISLLIFAGIVAGWISSIQGMIAVYDPSKLFGILAFLFVALATVVVVVIINEGQRNVPVSYARRVRGNKMYGGVNTHLPLKVNQAGVIPIIFAISLILIPPMIAKFFASAGNHIVSGFANFIINLFQNQVFYGVSYFLLVVGFTYFYTAIIFHPDQISENLQKQGGFIPGIRPGKHTAEYLQNIVTRINLAGSLFLGAVAVLPVVLQSLTKGLGSMVIGGTSILIVVSVVIETVKQINAQLTMRNYEEL